MCAPFSPNDTSEPTVTAFDLADAAEHTRMMVDAVTDVVRKVAIDDATSAQLGARGAQHANLLRLRFEESVIALRATLCNALAGSATTYASETDFADALKARIERNNRAILSTAMRRVDTAEAADAALTTSARARGADVVGRVYPATDSDFVSPAAA